MLAAEDEAAAIAVQKAQAVGPLTTLLLSSGSVRLSLHLALHRTERRLVPLRMLHT